MAADGGTPKFYLFDVEVTNALPGRKKVERNTPDFWHRLEQLIFLERR